MQKIVINKCFGGFGLSGAAYEELIRLGVPVKKYQEPTEDSAIEKVIYDRSLTPLGECRFNDPYWKAGERPDDRYWDTWTNEDRANPLLIQAVETLGAKADGVCALLKIVEVPDDVEWEISDYDGRERVEQVHQSWS
jgi:hypothetical protein